MKILLVSHNCFSTTQSMGKTFASLFSDFSAEELMQLYLYPTLPNTDQCTNLFRITDRDVLNSLLHCDPKCGRVIRSEEIRPDNTLYEEASNTEVYRKTRKAEILARRARDSMWMLGKWKSRELKAWLLDNKPDIVFYALGDAIFSQNIAMWAADFLKIPLVTYVCDEFYYYYRNLKNPFSRILCIPLTRNIKKTIKHSARLITICEELGEAYQKTFGVPYTTIMTGSSFPAGSLTIDDHARQISYIGNLTLNRWKSVQEIAVALKQVNAERNEDYKLVYYGSEDDHLNGYAEYGGRLDSCGVQNVMSKSRLLIHTESFEKEFRDRLRYSVSTKVADSLASGNCLLAYGPGDLASIRYLEKEQCAFVCDDRTALTDCIRRAVTDEKTRSEVKSRAVETARRNHNSLENSKKIREMFDLI